MFVAAPDQYETFEVVIVSADVPPPVVKLVADTVAVHVLVASPRPSETVTEPRAALRVPPGAALPRPAVAGTLIDSVPVVGMTVIWELLLPLVSTLSTTA
ncbi:hypothetical protein AB0D63_39110, partial [Kitasatospora sp. NPDC048343]|uniref:hypothetical protein n=1 Tax=Kitasatospora sp. NPDC048343 TaxID=3154717 RepID=UPI0033E14D48